MAMFVILPFLAMRQKPFLSEKIVSYALFAEKVDVLKEQGEWAYIKTPDQYPGWALKKGLFERGERYPVNCFIETLFAHIYQEPDIDFGPLMTLPFAASLLSLGSLDARFEKIELPGREVAYIEKGNLLKKELDFISFTKQFCNLPYTWGGRSSFGYDCSGFVQMVYSYWFNYSLPRDAQEQFQTSSMSPIGYEELAEGDLIFWGQTEKKIQHVGIYLKEKEFIHTSSKENKPYLRISLLSDPAWDEGKDTAYPFRAFRRVNLLGKDPEKQDCTGNFCT